MIICVLPYNLKRNHKICIICEGFEDYKYMEKIVSLNVWSKKYDFKLINAKGASNIFPIFQNAYSSTQYELVLIFCDTDKSPYKQYLEIKKKITNFFDNDKVCEEIIIFFNPCVMQIILSHFDKVKLITQSKKKNADIIFKLTNIKNYDAKENQIDELCGKIKRKNYFDMKENITENNFDDKCNGTTNFSKFIDFFENDNEQWIYDINEKLN